jgi:two-component system response regulator HydG
MQHIGGIAALKQIQTSSPEIPIVMMTAYASVPTAVEALKSGAYDYLTKPLNTDELKLLVTKTLRVQQLEKENIHLKEQLNLHFDVAGIIGQSPVMQSLFENLAMVAPSDASVLILGESGTGKELVAGAIHHNSPRKNQPFVKINCAALPEHLLASELFGHERGAYTGADRKRKGRFEIAHHGTIFLDEIAELKPATQAKLLRVIQEREFEPVGSSHTVKVDTRVIAATNRDLEVEIQADRFRKDLYYRLNVVALQVPPLRSRVQDIPLLTDFFLKRYMEKNQKLLKGLTSRAADLLLRYDWPGNVRELENVIERAVILTRSDTIGPGDLPGVLQDHGTSADPGSEQGILPGRSLKEMEKEMILATLEQTDQNRTHAADILGISRRTLQLKLKAYGIN